MHPPLAVAVAVALRVRSPWHVGPYHAASPPTLDIPLVLQSPARYVSIPVSCSSSPPTPTLTPTRHLLPPRSLAACAPHADLVSPRTGSPQGKQADPSLPSLAAPPLPAAGTATKLPAAPCPTPYGTAAEFLLNLGLLRSCALRWPSRARRLLTRAGLLLSSSPCRPQPQLQVFCRCC